MKKVTNFFLVPEMDKILKKMTNTSFYATYFHVILDSLGTIMKQISTLGRLQWNCCAKILSSKLQVFSWKGFGTYFFTLYVIYMCLPNVFGFISTSTSNFDTVPHVIPSNKITDMVP